MLSVSFICGCETIKKDEPQLKKIAEDAVDEEVDKIIKELP